MRYTFEKDGIYINPKLPTDFDITPHDKRDNEMNWWWNKPYIVIDELEQETYEEHYYRLKELGFSDEKIESKEDWNKYLEEERETWYKKFPTGFKYNVRCLDGGAWDRSTMKGVFTTFEEAIEVAKQLKSS
jgi:hypothetical protein